MSFTYGDAGCVTSQMCDLEPAKRRLSFILEWFRRMSRDNSSGSGHRSSASQSSTIDWIESRVGVGHEISPSADGQPIRQPAPDQHKSRRYRVPVPLSPSALFSLHSPLSSAQPQVLRKETQRRRRRSGLAPPLALPTCLSRTDPFVNCSAATMNATEASLKLAAVNTIEDSGDNSRRTRNGKFTLGQLRQTDGIVPLQSGTNQFDSQKGMTGFGTPRDVKGKHLKRIWELEFPEEAVTDQPVNLPPKAQPQQ
uniref:Calponin-homology (CH) domain-containing protein n=1 Tax=Steinernema glaseri TaxID=37863 RepID=A0A1I8AHJ0_9BILA